MSAPNSSDLVPAAASVATPAQPGSGRARSKERGESVLADCAAGSVAALVTLSYSVGYGALIFSGIDAAYLPWGLQAALMTCWLAALVVALGSSFHFAIAGPDSNATAILAIMSAAVIATLERQLAAPAEIAATVLAMVILCSILAGLLVFILGACRRGKLVRFLPYPVVGGFLAGTGYLIFAGGVRMLGGENLEWSRRMLEALARVPPLAWASMGVVAAGLLILPRLFKHHLILPGMILAGVAVFYAGFALGGYSQELAREQGLMFKPVAADSPQSETFLALMGQVRWEVLWGQTQNFLAMTVVVVITILLNATGLDLATQTDVDFDRELRVNGLANVVCGFAGGMIGYLSISRSVLNFKAGARSRAAGIWTAVLCLAVMLAGTRVVWYFPKPVLAGLLVFLGLSMLREWVWDAFFKLPLLEYLLIVAILLLIAAQGLISGVAFGLLVASVFFVYSYSRTPCIKHSFSGDAHFSNKERSLAEMMKLKKAGSAAQSLALQGYIFFGTSSAIVEACRELVDRGKGGTGFLPVKEDGRDARATPLRYLLLDFRRVQGLDASAVLGFSKLEQICANNGVRLLFSALHAPLQVVLEQARFLPKPEIKVFPDMDRALEWIEDNLLAEADSEAVPTSATGSVPAAAAGATLILAENHLRRILAAHFDPPSLNILIDHCETLKVAQGAAIFQQGDAGDSLYFIERGEVSVLLRLSAGETKRLRKFGPGTVVGEMALYTNQPRSAEVVADTDCRVRKLTSAALAKLEREHPQVAIQLHTFVVRLLSSRLAAANQEIRALI